MVAEVRGMKAMVGRLGVQPAMPTSAIKSMTSQPLCSGVFDRSVPKNDSDAIGVSTKCSVDYAWQAIRSARPSEVAIRLHSTLVQ